jgi:N-methylhydantoinase B
MPSKFLLTAKKDDVFRMVLAGAGGYGNPLERDPERVAADVREEKLSLDYVRREYGVVIDPQTLAVDIAATTVLRQRLAQTTQQEKHGC